MAYLMGQLGLAPSTEAALPFLQRAATLATIEVPQPAYVYGLLLLNDFTHIQIPPHLFAPLIPPSSSAPAEARIHLERAAYLNFSPALYKLGHSYEFATPPFPFDALLSVQYYSLASQGGEVEADMALSKWFLCGAEGAFEKDEGLAWTFAEKAAKRGLAAAEFAMGYYAEVGVGGPKDIESARRWYTRVSSLVFFFLHSPFCRWYLYLESGTDTFDFFNRHLNMEIQTPRKDYKPSLNPHLNLSLVNNTKP